MILMTVLKLRWFRIKYSEDNWQTHTGEITRGIVFPPQEGDRRWPDDHDDDDRDDDDHDDDDNDDDDHDGNDHDGQGEKREGLCWEVL